MSDIKDEVITRVLGTQQLILRGALTPIQRTYLTLFPLPIFLTKPFFWRMPKYFLTVLSLIPRIFSSSPLVVAPFLNSHPLFRVELRFEGHLEGTVALEDRPF
jgi:hypothetical protein